MVSIGKLGVGQERYYLDKVALGIEDYYSGEGEAQGYWLGRAAAALGLEGRIEPEQLGAMLIGSNPVDGEPPGLKSAPGREPVPGFDLTFSGRLRGSHDLRPVRRPAVYFVGVLSVFVHVLLQPQAPLLRRKLFLLPGNLRRHNSTSSLAVGGVVLHVV